MCGPLTLGVWWTLGVTLGVWTVDTSVTLGVWTVDTSVTH